MRIRLDLDSRTTANELKALKVFVDTLLEDHPDDTPSGMPEDIDHGSGPLEEFDASKVTITTSRGNGEKALARVNLDESVLEASLNEFEGDEPVSEVKVDVKGGEVTKETVSDEEVAAKAKKLAQAKKKPKKEVAESDKQPVTKKDVAEPTPELKTPEAVVDVETPDTKVEGTTVDEALETLEPKPATDKPVDHAVELRKLMVDVVKAHGPKGAKIASQVVNKIAGVKDVTKIPADKFEAVCEGLQAAINADGKPADEPEPPSTQAVDKKPDSEPSADDVDF